MLNYVTQEIQTKEHVVRGKRSDEEGNERLAESFGTEKGSKVHKVDKQG